MAASPPTTFTSGSPRVWTMTSPRPLRTTGGRTSRTWRRLSLGRRTRPPCRWGQPCRSVHTGAQIASYNPPVPTVRPVRRWLSAAWHRSMLGSLTSVRLAGPTTPDSPDDPFWDDWWTSSERSPGCRRARASSSAPTLTSTAGVPKATKRRSGRVVAACSSRRARRTRWRTWAAGPARSTRRAPKPDGCTCRLTPRRRWRDPRSTGRSLRAGPGTQCRGPARHGPRLHDGRRP